MNRTMFIGTELYYSQDFVDDRNKEIERLNNIIDKAIEELEIWQPKEKILQEERTYLLDILKGESND